MKNKPKTYLSKPGYAVGLEFDHTGIRGARVAFDGKGGFVVERLHIVQGDLGDEIGLIGGLREMKDKLGMTARDSVITCLAGKQISAMQIPFRRLPLEEMENALRLEMRKFVPFDVSGATLDYQVLAESDSQNESTQVLVAIAAGGLLDRQLRLMEKAGIKPHAVDVMPVAMVNALWTWYGAPKSDSPQVAVHVGPTMATIVVDGPKSPFFNRYVYSSAEEFLKKDVAHPDREKRLGSLAEEVAQSLSFYEKTFFVSGFREIMLLGEFLEASHLEEHLRKQTGLIARKMDIAKKLGFADSTEPGRFDVAVALGLRGDD